MKLKSQLKDHGSLNSVPLRIRDLRLSLYTIFTSSVMTCPAGLQLKGKEEQDRNF